MERVREYFQIRIIIVHLLAAGQKLKQRHLCFQCQRQYSARHYTLKRKYGDNKGRRYKLYSSFQQYNAYHTHITSFD